MFPELNLPQTLAVSVIPIVFAVTVHEVAHGWVADKLGDHTARYQGRLTLNPIHHIDIVGTLIVPLLLLALGGFLFGWAKPVPVDVRNLRKPKRDMALVAVAGPLANLIMAIFWGVVAQLGAHLAQGASEHFLIYMGFFGIFINLILLVLNMLPIPPLDGSRVLSSLLPPRLSYYYNRIEPYGLILLVFLLFSGLLQQVMAPIFNTLLTVVLSLFQ